MSVSPRPDGAVAPAHPLTLGHRGLMDHLPSGVALDAAQRSAASFLATPHRHGAYLCGGVGRGKSLLAEAYLAALPTRRKRRVHFHDFFLELQGSLGASRAPLERALDRLIGGSRAILFDEFHVHDVADAVYLTATLRHLVEQNVLLIATSNDTPEELLPGLWHEHFTPSIRLIRTHLDVIEVADGTDYRHVGTASSPGRGFASGSWTVSTGGELAPVIELTTGTGISIAVREYSAQQITTTFEDLCDAPLGTAQYLWLARRTTALRLVDVPDLSTVHREALLRFCHLVDVLYDRDVRVDVLSRTPLTRPTTAGVPPRSVDRALSRLSSLRHR